MAGREGRVIGVMTSRAAWEFAGKVIDRAIARGKRIVVYEEGGKVTFAVSDTRHFRSRMTSGDFIGVYTDECLIRDLVSDLEEFFK